jgi:hypothetical protein
MKMAVIGVLCVFARMKASEFALAFVFSAMLAVLLWEIVTAFDRATRRIIGVFVWLLLALCRPVRWLCFKILQVAVLALILGFVAFLVANIKGIPMIYLFKPPPQF